MAINNTKVLFQYGSGSAAAAAVAGALTFDATAKAIYVGDGSVANLVTSAVKDATFTNRVLTVSKVDGTSFTLDFSDVASAEGVNSLLATLRDDINTLDASVSTLKGRVDNHDTSLANLDASYKAADTALETKLVGDASVDYNTLGKLQAKIEDVDAVAGGAQTSEQVQTAITNAINNLDSSVEDADASSFVNVKVEETDGKLTAITVTTTDIASASDLSGHIADTVKHITADERTAWNAAKSAIDTFLKDADMTTDAVDTLKELQKYMTDDASAANALVNRVGANETAIATLNGNASTVGSVAKAVADVVGDAAEEYNTLGKLEDKIQAEAKAREDADKDLNDKIDAITDGTNAVISFGGQKGEITVRGEQTGNGAVNLSMNDKQLEASIVGLKSAAFTDSSAYATAAQGTKADTAVQNVVEGDTNGTIKVDGTEVAVHGLGSAAFTEASAYDTAGAASTAKNEAISAVTGTTADTSDKVTLYGVKKYAEEAAQAAADAATVTGVDTTAVADASSYVTIALKLDDNKKVTVNSVAVDTQAVADADASTDGLATAYDVKQYVDNQIATNALSWVVLE